MSLTQPPSPSPLEVTLPLMGPWWYFLGCCLGDRSFPAGAGVGCRRVEL